MTIDINEFNHLRQKVQKLQRDADKAEGALNEQLKHLKEEFDCDSIEEAEAYLVELEKKVAAAEKIYRKELKEFRKQWGDKL
jgi:predicted  nucleic acid-binding Zn-ribbon protein